ncbi:MAG: radical SAM protein [Sedimentisphaerales bacterium]|nr:radical SAM protein [Sedimentisphaerales bacterium]
MDNTNDKFKILLLSVSSTSFFYDQVVIPFGLVSLASFVDYPDYQIKGIELNWPAEKIMQRYLKVDDEVMQQILDFSPDMVAMSTYASNMYNCLFWADAIKRKLPNCFIVAGGNHVSYIAKECLSKCDGIDAVVRFEGEIPFKMLCEKRLTGNTDFEDVPNLTWRKNGEIVENQKTILLDSLESLPIINRTYFSSQQTSKSLTHADVISARGCPFHCTFCDCNHYWQKTHRTRGAESVVRELTLLIKDNPDIKSVRFRDESITLKKPYCMALCKSIIDNGINLEFHAHSRLDGLDEELIATLAEAGFKLLFIGIESGSERVLKNLKKGIRLDRLAPNLELLRKYGINFRLSFMSSTPGETFFDTFQTVKLIKKLKLKRNEYYMGIGIDIYPGTEECAKFIELNPDYEWINNKDIEFNGRYSAKKDPFGNIINPKFRQYSLLKSAVIFFLLSPSYLFERVTSVISKKIKKFLPKK